VTISKDLHNEPAILVMIPTFNDKELIQDIVTEIHHELPTATVLVIDDGSSPKLDRSNDDPPYLMTHLPTNFGLGVCMHVAFDHLLEHDYDILVRVDADGQHPVGTLPALIAPILEEKASYVVGCRSNRNDSKGLRSALARFVRGYMELIVKAVSRKTVPDDVTSGFVAIDREAVKFFNEGMLEQYPEPQMCLRIGLSSFKATGVPVEQSNRAHGQSTISLGHAIRFLYRFNIIVLASLFQSGGPK
jgi:glycosyltransferase involved in cell wall biosynthesis